MSDPCGRFSVLVCFSDGRDVLTSVLLATEVVAVAMTLGQGSKLGVDSSK